MSIREIVKIEENIYQNHSVGSYPNGLLSVMDFVRVIKNHIVKESNFYIFFNPDVEHELRCCFFNDQSVYLGKKLILIPEPTLKTLEPKDGVERLNFIISLDDKCLSPIAAIYGL